MSGSVYLDYAATSAVRPPEVGEAVAEYLSGIGATPGRSGHRRAVEAGRVALRCRRLLAEIFGIPGDPGRITFQPNATFALNAAIFGTLSRGDRVVRTALDHNAVRRPVAALVRRGVEETVLPVGPRGEVDLSLAERILAAAGKSTRLLALPHASNVSGAVLPVAELAELAHSAGALVLVDVAQTAGHYPVDVPALGADLVAFTGHKGLLGPQGTGGLWVREGVAVEPLVYGGTGGDSAPAEMPEAYPDRLEAGTLNGPGIAGLAAGVSWLLDRGVPASSARESDLKRRLLSGLEGIPGLRIRSAPEGVGIVTMVHEDVDPAELARRVERSHGIQGRAGLHCAPEAHASIGTLATGAYRLSVGWATTEADVDTAIAALRAIGSDREAA